MQKETRLFTACIVSLIATSFGFGLRASLLNDIGVAFDLSETHKGALQGAGLYPFALSIIFFSLVVDKLGYGRAMAIAWVGHMLSAFLTIFAQNFAMLYVGTLVFALANGTVEAVINPVTATLYPKSKTKHLSILHAGWPAGIVLGCLFIVWLSGFQGEGAWRWKLGLFIIPTIIYGLMMVGHKFPPQERVAAGITYKDMLREFGWAGGFICFFFVFLALNEIVRAVSNNSLLSPGMELRFALMYAIIPTILFAIYIRSFGRPMFIFLLLVMIPLATTELGTDSWIIDLMTPVLADLSQHAGTWVLAYTAFIMLVLRFAAGPIVHRLGTLGLLLSSAAIAAIGLFWLSNATAAAIAIFLAATCYGIGKTFFWPGMLGLVSEQFPKGGALTINAIAGIGMISVGTLGNTVIGAVQDEYLDRLVQNEAPAIHAQITEEQTAKFGMEYQPISQKKVQELPEEEQKVVQKLRTENKQNMLSKIAVLPVIMFLCYGGIWLYFRGKGGYKAVELQAEKTKGGTAAEGPAEP